MSEMFEPQENIVEGVVVPPLDKNKICRINLQALCEDCNKKKWKGTD